MVQKCCKQYSKQRDNISVCSMEVGVLEVWNDIDTESESEVSNEECEDDLMQKCIGRFIRGREHHPAIICGWSQWSLNNYLHAQKETLLCMSGRKLVVTVR